MHLPPLDSLTYIGGGLIAAVVACAIHHAWTRFALWADAPWAYTEAILDEATEDISFERHCDTTPGLDEMPLHDRIAHDEMASFFAEWDQRVKEESA